MLRTTRHLAVGAAFATALSLGLAGGVVAQDAVEIRANGPNVVDNAAGADNVRVEVSPGRRQAAASEGQGNQEIRRAPRDDRARQRDDRDRNRGGNNGGGDSGAAGAAPAAAPADSARADPQAAAEGRGAATSQAATKGVGTAAPQAKPVQLPSTGSGLVGSLSGMVALFGAVVAAAGGWVIRRRA